MSDAKCYLCGKQTSSIAANPSVWPVEFEYRGGNGQRRTYCRQCVIVALEQPASAQPNSVADWIEKWSRIIEEHTHDEDLSKQFLDEFAALATREPAAKSEALATPASQDAAKEKQ